MAKNNAPAPMPNYGSGKSHNAVVGARHDPRSAKGAKTGGMKGGKC